MKNNKRDSLMEQLSENIKAPKLKFKSLYCENDMHIIRWKKDYRIVKESDNSLGFTFVNDTLFKTPKRAKLIINNLLSENKYVIKKDIPTPDSEPNMEMDNDEIDVDLDAGMGDEEEVNLDDDVEVSEHQELTGKLAYILRDNEQQIDDYDETVKYIFNTLIGSLQFDKVDGNVLNSIKDKFETENEESSENSEKAENQEIDEKYLKEITQKKGYVFEKIVSIDELKNFSQTEVLEERVNESDIAVEEKGLDYYLSDAYLEDDEYDEDYMSVTDAEAEYYEQQKEEYEEDDYDSIIDALRDRNQR